MNTVELLAKHEDCIRWNDIALKERFKGRELEDAMEAVLNIVESLQGQGSEQCNHLMSEQLLLLQENPFRDFFFDWDDKFHACIKATHLKCIELINSGH
jgi:hypothetical protein